MFYATSYTFQNDSETAQILQEFIKRIRSSPLDAYPILLELKLILNNNLRDSTEVGLKFLLRKCLYLSLLIKLSISMYVVFTEQSIPSIQF